MSNKILTEYKPEQLKVFLEISGISIQKEFIDNVDSLSVADFELYSYYDNLFSFEFINKFDLFKSPIYLIRKNNKPLGYISKIQLKPISHNKMYHTTTQLVSNIISYSLQPSQT